MGTIDKMLTGYRPPGHSRARRKGHSCEGFCRRQKHQLLAETIMKFYSHELNKNLAIYRVYDIGPRSGGFMLGRCPHLGSDLSRSVAPEFAIQDLRMTDGDARHELRLMCWHGVMDLTAGRPTISL